jgi:thiamine biosynthesis lipoprotein
MGMPIGFDVRDPSVDEAAIDAAVARLTWIDATFSTYKPESEVSRLARGELALEACAPEVRQVLELGELVGALSDGAFSIHLHGRLDPTGIVKGWAVEQAAAVLRTWGARSFSVNAGGDIVCAGVPAEGRPWRVGIRHPAHANAVAAIVELPAGGAVATSGTYERGRHLVDPRTGAAVDELASLTVVGPDLTFTDAYATAAYVMGLDGVTWVGELPGYEALAIVDDELVHTAGFPLAASDHRGPATPT